MPVLHTWSPEDGLLGAIAPVALAAVAETALVVDLDPQGPAYPGELTLAQLVAHGPRAEELRPSRRGVAILGNGGVAVEEATPVVAALTAGWPNVVLRLAPGEPPEADGVVPVFPLTPLTTHPGPAVFQRGPFAIPDPPPGILLPRPRASTVRALLEGRRPGASRWMRAWHRVWRQPWA